MQVQVRRSSFEVPAELHQQIREHAEELRTLYPEVLAVRVTIDPASPDYADRPRFQARLELHVPGALVPIPRQYALTPATAVDFAFDAALVELDAHRRTRDRLSQEVA